MRRAALAALLAAALVLGSEAPARAQDPGNSAAAEVLYNQGRQLMGERRFDEACRKLAESHRLDPGIGVALYLGECYAAAGKHASAWGAFREAAALARSAKDAREKVASARSSAIEPRLFKVAIVVGPRARVPGLIVTRDGTSIADAAWETDVPLDPGRYTVIAVAPGKRSWTQTIEVPDHAGSLAVEIPPLESDSAPPRPVAPAAPPVTPPPPPAAPREQEPAPGSSRRLLGAVVAGAGLVGVGVGTVFGLRAMSAHDDVRGHCQGTVCDSPSAVSRREDGRSQATVSTIAFAAGAGLLAIGVLLILTAPSGRAVAAPLRLDPTSGLVELAATF